METSTKEPPLRNIASSLDTSPMFTSPPVTPTLKQSTLSVRRQQFLQTAKARGWLVAPQARHVAHQALAAWRAGLLPKITAPPTHDAVDSVAESLGRSLSIGLRGRRASGMSSATNVTDMKKQSDNGYSNKDDTNDDGAIVTGTNISEASPRLENENGIDGSPKPVSSETTEEANDDNDIVSNIGGDNNNFSEKESETDSVRSSEDSVSPVIQTTKNIEAIDDISDDRSVSDDDDIENGADLGEDTSSSHENDYNDGLSEDDEDIIYAALTDNEGDDGHSSSDESSSCTTFGNVTDDETPPRTPARTPMPSATNILELSPSSSSEQSASSRSEADRDFAEGLTPVKVIDVSEQSHASYTSHGSNISSANHSPQVLQAFQLLEAMTISGSSTTFHKGICETPDAAQIPRQMNNNTSQDLRITPSATPQNPSRAPNAMFQDLPTTVSAVPPIQTTTPKASSRDTTRTPDTNSQNRFRTPNATRQTPRRTPKSFRTQRSNKQYELLPENTIILELEEQTSVLKGVSEWLGKGPFAQVRSEAADRLLQYFDREVLGGAVINDERGQRRVTVGWNARLYKTAGVTHLRRRVTSGELLATIDLSIKVVDEPIRLYNTLAHELCHAAVWIVDKTSKPPHGPHFKAWVRRFADWDSRLSITTCHQYSIRYKFNYECVACGQTYGRHSRSINTTQQVCGKCKGRLELVVS